MGSKEILGLSEIELVKLINKRKKRYCAILLNDLEGEIKDEETYKKVRKLFLDNMNGFARSVLTVIGIDIEGIKDE